MATVILSNQYFTHLAPSDFVPLLEELIAAKIHIVIYADAIDEITSSNVSLIDTISQSNLRERFQNVLKACITIEAGAPPEDIQSRNNLSINHDKSVLIPDSDESISPLYYLIDKPIHPLPNQQKPYHLIVSSHTNRIFFRTTLRTIIELTQPKSDPILNLSALMRPAVAANDERKDASSSTMSQLFKCLEIQQRASKLSENNASILINEILPTAVANQDVKKVEAGVSSLTLLIETLSKEQLSRVAVLAVSLFNLRFLPNNEVMFESLYRLISRISALIADNEKADLLVKLFEDRQNHHQGHHDAINQLFTTNFTQGVDILYQNCVAYLAMVANQITQDLDPEFDTFHWLLLNKAVLILPTDQKHKPVKEKILALLLRYACDDNNPLIQLKTYQLIETMAPHIVGLNFSGPFIERLTFALDNATTTYVGARHLNECSLRIAATKALLAVSTSAQPKKMATTANQSTQLLQAYLLSQPHHGMKVEEPVEIPYNDLTPPKKKHLLFNDIESYFKDIADFAPLVSAQTVFNFYLILTNHLFYLPLLDNKSTSHQSVMALEQLADQFRRLHIDPALQYNAKAVLEKILDKASLLPQASIHAVRALMRLTTADSDIFSDEMKYELFHRLYLSYMRYPSHPSFRMATRRMTDNLVAVARSCKHISYQQKIIQLLNTSTAAQDDNSDDDRLIMLDSCKQTIQAGLTHRSLGTLLQRPTSKIPYQAAQPSLDNIDEHNAHSQIVIRQFQKVQRIKILTIAEYQEIDALKNKMIHAFQILEKNQDDDDDDLLDLSNHFDNQIEFYKKSHSIRFIKYALYLILRDCVQHDVETAALMDVFGENMPLLIAECLITLSSPSETELLAMGCLQVFLHEFPAYINDSLMTLNQALSLNLSDINNVELGKLFLGAAETLLRYNQLNGLEQYHYHIIIACKNMGHELSKKIRRSEHPDEKHDAAPASRLTDLDQSHRASTNQIPTPPQINSTRPEKMMNTRSICAGLSVQIPLRSRHLSQPTLLSTIDNHKSSLPMTWHYLTPLNTQIMREDKKNIDETSRSRDTFDNRRR